MGAGFPRGAPWRTIGAPLATSSAAGTASRSVGQRTPGPREWSTAVDSGVDALAAGRDQAGGV